MPLIVGATLASLTLASCSPLLSGGSDPGGNFSQLSTVDTGQRAYALITTGCGHASATEGTGVALGGGRVLTVAHVVSGSSSVQVVSPGGANHVGRVIALDVGRDLALIQITDEGLEPLAIAEAADGDGDGDEAVVETRTGSIPVKIVQAALLDVAEIGGSDRSERRGFRLDGTTTSGDSGSGLFVENTLVGLVFATTTGDDSVTWATASTEIRTFLDDAVTEEYFCDVSKSRLVTSGD